MGYRASLSEGLAMGALSFVSLALLGVVSSVTIARIFGIGTLGENALALAPTVALGFLSTFKEQAALVRELAVLSPRASRVTGLAAAVFTFSFAVTTVIGGLAMVGTYLLFAGPINRPDLFVYALVNAIAFLFIGNTCWNADVILSSFRAGRALFWVRLHQAVSYLALTIVAGIVWGTLWALTLAAVGSWTTSLVHRLVVLRRFVTPRVPRAEIREGFRALPAMVRFGLRIAPAGMATGVTTGAATWVIGAIAPISSVGAYNRAWLLGERLNDVPNRVVEMLFPTLVERRASGDRAGFDRSLVDSMRYSLFGLLAIATVGGGAAHEIMRLFGPGFDQAADALAIILLLPALATVGSIQVHALYAFDRTLLTVVLALGRMVLTLGLTIVLVGAMGVTGAALALFVGQLSGVVVLWPVVNRLLAAGSSELWPYRQRAALVLAAVTGFVCSRGIEIAIGGPGAIPVALLTGCIAFGLVLLCGGVTPRDRRRFEMAVARLRAFRIRAAATS